MTASRLESTVLACWCALTCALIVGVGVAGAVPAGFGSSGTGAGEFHEIHGVAVDQGNGDVYVVDRNNQRIEKFTSEGVFLLGWGWGVADGHTQALQTCTTTCFKGIEGAGAGQLSFPEGVAVDNDPLSLSYEDVYVLDIRNNRVEKFSPSGSFLSMFGKEVNETTGGDVCLTGESCKQGREGAGNGEFEFSQGAGSVALDTAGNTYVIDGTDRVQEFSPGGVYVTSVALPGIGPAKSLAVDSSGDLYVPVISSGVSKYDSSGTLLSTFDSTGEAIQLALDAAGDLFVVDQRNLQRVLEYAPSGVQLSSIDTGENVTSSSLAWGETSERSYLSQEFTVRLISRPAPGPSLRPESESASGIQSTSATLNAGVNPQGHATKYRFEYGPTVSYGTSAPIGEGSLAASFTDEPVDAALTKLVAGTTYHYRVVATDSEGNLLNGPDETFTTLPALLIDSESVSSVASTSATIEAQLNPLGAEASYRLEYGPSGSYGTSWPEASIGSSSNDVTVSARIDGLPPHSTFHYRVVAHDEREGVEYTVEGPDHVFTTQTGGGALTLADGRSWELVSPADKLGARLFGPRQTILTQASAGGDAMTYVANSPSEAEPAGYGALTQIFSKHGVSGWSSSDIVPHYERPVGALGRYPEFHFFSEDLSRGLFEIRESPSEFAPVSPLASEPTPYVRQQGLCASDPSASECYIPIVTGKTGYADVPPGTIFDETNNENVIFKPVFDGATPDLRHVGFVSDGKAALTGTPGTPEALYEWSMDKPPGERLQLVSLLPVNEGGGPASGVLGTHFINGAIARNAISSDGSRVFWSHQVKSFGGALYMRDLAKGETGETIRLDVAQAGLPQNTPDKPEGVIFQFASSDGSKAFFTDQEKLTRNAGAKTEQPDLYECDIVERAGKLACDLTDLTPLKAGEVAGVRGTIPGAGVDASYVYFVANGVLAPGGTPGNCEEEQRKHPGEACNLYVRHDGVTTFIARLAGGDVKDWAGGGNEIAELNAVTARVSPNGRYLTFMSATVLTGYENRDARSGAADAEVYLYDAQEGRLVCASCNPTGARPAGTTVSTSQLVGSSLLEGAWFAATTPNWTAIEGGGFLGIKARYQRRYLSDSGRLFFEASDALVPQDINGTMDVYEYEPAGVGSCSEASTTFSATSGGCVGLVSSGSSADESAFVDASVTGDDVFFLTTEKLVSSDTDSALDVYDAHACGTGWSCVSEQVSSSACTTADACRVAPSPQPASFGAPASATFAGAGNVSTRGPVGSVKGRSLTRAQKLAGALRACRKTRGKRRRTVCERRARRRYGPVGSGVSAAKRGRG